MKMPNGFPGSLQLKRGRYYYKYTFDGDSKPTMKAMIPPGQNRATEDEKTAVELAIIYYRTRTGQEQRHDGTVEGLCVTYLADRKKYHTNGDGVVAGQYGVTVSALKYLRDEQGNDLVANFNAIELEKFQGFMIKSKRVCRKEINRRVKIVQKMWRWAVKEQLAPANRSSYEIQSVDSIPEGKMGTYDYVKVTPVKWDMIELTIKYCERVLADMILIQWLTGMRPSELCRMPPGAIDRTADVWVYDLKKSYNPDTKEKTENEDKSPTRKKKTLKSKTENKGNDRFVYLGPKAQSVLQQYLLRPAGEPCFSPRENLALYNASRRKERLAPQHTGWQSKGVSSRIGIAYNAKTYRNAIKYVINRANRELRKLKLKEIQDWTPYQIRHSYSTIADEKFDVETSAALCGHGVNVAESTYIKRRKDIAIDAARKIG